ncbi:hypothetical protein BGW38_006462 [Lunasporangiospora selenospora]|uniref:Uncharacterized protein n=1 Tax=Lunasporangiospora selenospora TaxID=979761 RepID=A0A9P6FLT1_9FUNG|nr:hypothetical protein BGW38_006462 [Lunasporangiospora selenospora]
MLLVPDLAAISLVCVLLWGRLRVQDDVHHTIFRILASICLVTLSIYRPIIFIAQLQTLIDYLQHAGKSNPTSSETPFTQLYSCQGPFNTPGDDQSQQNNTQFCWVFWVRIMFTFSWAFMVLAELMVAYADGEFCPEKKGFPTETELRTRRTGSGENVVEYNMLRTSEEGGQ